MYVLACRMCVRTFYGAKFYMFTFVDSCGTVHARQRMSGNLILTLLFYLFIECVFFFVCRVSFECLHLLCRSNERIYRSV